MTNISSEVQEIEACPDWDEIRRLAALPAFNIADEIESLRKEVVDGD